MDSPLIYNDTPEPLKILCIKRIIKDPLHLRRYVRYMYKKSPPSVLPTEIADLLAVAFREYALFNRLEEVDCDRFFAHFKHKYIPLSKINFSGLPISERLMNNFLEEYQSQISEINIMRCPGLHNFNLKKLNTLQENDSELTLVIGDTSTSIDRSPSGRVMSQERVFNDRLRVKKLVLHQVRPTMNNADLGEFHVNQRLSGFLTSTMSTTLKYLDLSNCLIGNGSALIHLESLEVLILYNCGMRYSNVINTICLMKKLRVLDLSRQVVDDLEDTVMLEEDPKLLDHVVNKLSNLEYLDISGTDYIGSKDRNISVFESRLDRPFKFLGLFHTANDAAYRSCIPALTVAGEANEIQILNACEAYMERPEQLSRALSDLYNLYKTITPSETFSSVSRALDIVLTILTKHTGNEQVIVFTTAALWCIVKINVTTRNRNDARVRRTITSRLLDVMHYHKMASRVILINGGLTLLNLPDILCEHSRVAKISLHMCQDSDPRTQTFGTTLLNTLACQVGGEQKIYIGELNAIETMIEIIKAKVKENNCDEILETAWSTLWNITDETPVNCEKFLQCDGFEAFEICMDKFSHNKEVLRNIMGLLGNVSECKALRMRFMCPRYIRRFESFLSSPIDGIESSYNACGILAHLISEGQEFWDTHLESIVSRQEIMSKMCAAINRWPINERRNINYRSFGPIVRLLDLDIAPASQYWAVFALANLTRINPAKYCPMLLPFDGLVKLRRLAAPGATESFVQNLAVITIYQYDRFEEEHTLSGLEQCSSVDMEVIKSFRAEPINGDGVSDMGEMML